MPNLKGMEVVVSQLRVERTNLVDQLQHIETALAVLSKLNGGSSYASPTRTLSAAARRKISLAQKARWAKRAANGQINTAQPKRTMSAAARRKIAAAQRARWAKVRGNQSEPPANGRPKVAAVVKRTMSASARRKIAAAQRARWARVKAQKKAA